MTAEWLNLFTAPGSVSNEPGSVTWLATKYLKTVSWRNHTEKLTTWWPQNQSFWPKINIPSSYFTILMLNCLENTLKLQFDSYVWQLSNSWPNQFQNNLSLTWPSKTAGISLDSRLEYSIITHRYAKASPFTWFLCWNFLLIQISSILSVIFIRLWLKCQRVFWRPSCTSARHAGSFDCLMTSLILITMDNGRGHCTYWQSCKVPNQTHRGMKKK